MSTRISVISLAALTVAFSGCASRDSFAERQEPAAVGSGSASVTATAHGSSSLPATNSSASTPLLSSTSAPPLGTPSAVATTVNPVSSTTGGAPSAQTPSATATSVGPVMSSAGTGGAGGAPEPQPSGGAGGESPMEPPVQVPEPTLITSGENSFWQVGEVMEGQGNANVTVSDSTQQEWMGFGGTFNERGWVALGKLSAEDRERALKLLFDKVDGLAFDYGRIPIGASDYAVTRYSLNDVTEPDYEMEHFTIERDREALIPYIKAALDVNPAIKFWASPWTPPPWMKDNNAYDRGNMKTDEATLRAHALYLARFVQEYATEGINVGAVHPQNEAGYAQDYPSCGWSPQQMTGYIGGILGPLFAEMGLETEVWAGTMSNPQADKAIADAVTQDATAMQFVKGVGLQWGMQEHAAGYAQRLSVPVIQTEHKCGNYPWETGTYRSDKAPNDYAYALESWGLLKGWITSGVNAYMAWNMVLNTKGDSLDTVRPWNQNALLTVDEQAGMLILTPTYYVFRHLSQYIEPGAVRVDTQGGDALAFKNPDGSIVTVVHNSSGQAADTTLAVAGTTLSFSVPARGWATVNWQASE